MIIDELVKRPGLWFADDGDESGVVVSSRVRLARNMTGCAFPGWAGEAERVRLCGTLRSACTTIPALEGSVYFDMGSLTAIDREVLKERRLVSHELAEKGRGSGLLVAEDEQLAVMINEEDHLRLQAIRPGMDLAEVWRRIDRLDTELEARLDFAFSEKLGFLTACPSNVGTGLRASVMMHLSGLRLLGEADAVVNGLVKLGMAVRGLLGEGTDAHGNLYQVSNQATLGESEEKLIERLVHVVDEVTMHEQNARERLLEDRRVYLEDRIGRAFGVLTYARVLSSHEALDMLAVLRLGVELGMIRKLTIARINEVMLLSQPGHLQKMAGRALGSEERDALRANLVRDYLKGIDIGG